MLILSPTEIEQRFAADPGKAMFPFFCDALIAHEAPHTSTSPILTSKAGPDGGIDGEWDLTQAAPFDPASIARNGWNVGGDQLRVASRPKGVSFRDAFNNGGSHVPTLRQRAYPQE